MGSGLNEPGENFIVTRAFFLGKIKKIAVHLP